MNVRWGNISLLAEPLLYYLGPSVMNTHVAQAVLKHTDEAQGLHCFKVGHLDLMYILTYIPAATLSL